MPYARITIAAKHNEGAPSGANLRPHLVSLHACNALRGEGAASNPRNGGGGYVMKRRPICMLVLAATLLASTPTWAVPSAKAINPVDQAFEWLGALWAGLWTDTGNYTDPSAAQPVAPVWAETGGCVDPYGRPTSCADAPDLAPPGTASERARQ